MAMPSHFANWVSGRTAPDYSKIERMRGRAWAFAVSLLAASAARAVPTADEALTEMGLTAAEKKRVLDGEFVTSNVGSVSDRDLSFAVAFLVKATPDEIMKQAMAGALIPDDPQVKAYGMMAM